MTKTSRGFHTASMFSRALDTNFGSRVTMRSMIRYDAEAPEDDGMLDWLH